MGRPINKRFFGADDASTATATYDASGNTVATATLGDNAGSSYAVAEVLTNATGTIGNGSHATFTVDSVSTIAAQDESNFDGVGDNGTWVGGDGAGGTAYAPADTITLDEGTVITVDAVDGNGDVTEFTVTSASTSGNLDNLDTLTQASTSGTGDGFTLTLGLANQQIYAISLTSAGEYQVDPTLDESTTTASASGTGATVDLTMNADGGTPSNVTVTYGGSGYTSNITAGSTTNGVSFDFTATDGAIASGTVNSGTSTVIGTDDIPITMDAPDESDGSVQILGTAWIPGEGAAESVYIVRQRSSRKFEVASAASPTTTGVVKTVDGPTPAEGEIVIPVEPSDGAGGSTGTEYARIITGRKVRTFDGNIYKWGERDNDESGEAGIGVDMPPT
jgi:hypothetical protein